LARPLAIITRSRPRALCGQSLFTRFIADAKGAWTEHRPSAGEENEFIRLYGFSEYTKWHLGVDTRFTENTKRRYKFPYGDFKNVHRCGVLAARSRAAEYRYSDIKDAAMRLIEMIRQRK
jgi:hypothetical protein